MTKCEDIKNLWKELALATQEAWDLVDCTHPEDKEEKYAAYRKMEAARSRLERLGEIEPESQNYN